MTATDWFGALQGGGFLGAMLWAGRTESRLNAIDAVSVERDDKLHKRIDDLVATHVSQNDKLDKILEAVRAR